MATTTITQSVNTESGYVGYFGFAGNPPSSGVFDSGSSAGYSMANTGNFSGTNASFVGVLSFDTSVIPDTDTISSAYLELSPQLIENANTLSLQGDYYNWSLAAGSYANPVGSDAFSGILLASMSVGTYYQIPLSALTSISKTGTTKIRFGFSVAWSGAQGTNRIRFDDSTKAKKPRIVITHAPPGLRTAGMSGMSGMSGM